MLAKAARVWCMVYGVWWMVYGGWCMVYGCALQPCIWCMVHSFISTVYGVWCMVCGVWCMECMVYSTCTNGLLLRVFSSPVTSGVVSRLPLVDAASWCIAIPTAVSKCSTVDTL
jgi:hypothetical protein